MDLSITFYAELLTREKSWFSVYLAYFTNGWI